MKYIAILLVFVVLFSGCTQEQKPITEITIQGHGSQVYTFSNDIKAADKLYVQQENEIKNFFDTNDKINIVFDGSDPKENSYFTVIVTNMNKIPIFYGYEGRLVGFRPVYYMKSEYDINDTVYTKDIWYDSEGNNVTTPTSVSPAIWLIGPNTGATKNSLELKDGVLYLEGTDYKNLTLLTDKLSLIVMGLSGKIQ